MKTQVLKMIHHGTYTVIFDDTAKTNPYKIYLTHFTNGTKHKNKVGEYADLYSCLCYLKVLVALG